MIVSKLKGARQRKRSTGVKVEGRKNYAQAVPATVDRAKALKAEGLTLRQVAERLAASVGRLPDARREPVSVHGGRAHDFRENSITPRAKDSASARLYVVDLGQGPSDKPRGRCGRPEGGGWPPYGSARGYTRRKTFIGLGGLRSGVAISTHRRGCAKFERGDAGGAKRFGRHERHGALAAITSFLDALALDVLKNACSTCPSISQKPKLCSEMVVAISVPSWRWRRSRQPRKPPTWDYFQEPLTHEHNRRAGAVTGVTRQATFQPAAPR
jgi:hypothetical protein